MIHARIGGVLLLALTLFADTALAGHHGEPRKNIVETAAAAGQFETLIAAAKAAGLVGALTGEGPLTVFAPTDEAFSALPAGTIETLLEPGNKDELARILSYHVIAGRVGSDALADGATLDTLARTPATIRAAEKGFTIEGARIVATDIAASNGVVHVIDRVILPPERMTRTHASDLIRMAIHRGVPMFNHGNPEATAALYTLTAESLLRLASGEMDAAEVGRLERGLSESRHASGARAQAWALRYALDDVSASLAGRGEMSGAPERMTASR